MTFTELSKIRHEFMRKIRLFFEERDFLEIQTPLLVKNPGFEPDLEYFSTEWKPSMTRGRRERFFLPTSPEYHLKKALGHGLPRIYEISRSFRNGEHSKKHEPEFLMLEWYRSPGDYRQIADDTFELFQYLAQEFSPHPEKWKRRRDQSVCEAFQNFCKIDLEKAIRTDPEIGLTKIAIENREPSITATDDFEAAFHKLLLDHVEKNLGPNSVEFFWDYPAKLAALSKKKVSNPLFCERFEVYWNGYELGNAFGELTDPLEQRRRFVEDQQARRLRYPTEDCPPIDEELLAALEKIHHPCAGIAVGVDRLLQCLLEEESLQKILLFPKSLGM
jgi:elongation factor P--(R)-beta-lysine ligase